MANSKTKEIHVPMYTAQISYTDGRTDEVYSNPIIFRDNEDATKLYLESVKELEGINVKAIFHIADYFPLSGKVIGKKNIEEIYNATQEGDEKNEEEIDKIEE